MFERFTDRARRVLVLAQEDARALGHNFLGTEHILLGLVREKNGVAARVLGRLGVEFEPLHAEVTRLVPASVVEAHSRKPPFTPRAKKVLELSLREALRLKHNYIGTEHILLGLLREGEGAGVRALLALGVNLDDVRGRVLQLIERADPADLLDRRSGHVPDPRRRSPALTRVLADAEHQTRDDSVMTTSHVIRSVLGVPDSQGALALTRLGVTAEALEHEVTAIPLAQTSDSPPESRRVEIKLGDVTTTIADPDLAAALQRLSPEQIREVLQQLVTKSFVPASHKPGVTASDEAGGAEAVPKPPVGEAEAPTRETKPRTGEADAG